VERCLAAKSYAAGPWVVDLADKTYIVRFKPPQMGIQLVAASSAEIQGEHIALLNANGQLAALLLLDIVESWMVL
jgi:hypothetical protein